MAKCKICFEEIPISSFVKTCQDGHSFCNGCLGSYFSSSISEGTVESLGCPEPGCVHRTLDPSTIKDLVAQDIFQRYLLLKFYRHLDASPDISWCPKPQCHSPVVFNVGIRRKNAKCGECGHCFCPRCKSEAHYGPCPEFAKPKIEQEVMDWLLNNTKQCPVCFIYINKNGGCDHMHCIRCNTHFSWIAAPLDTKPPLLKGRNGWSNFAAAPFKEKPCGKKCPSCGIFVERSKDSNLLSCTNCKRKFCYSCNTLIKNPVSHFQAGSPCSFHGKKPKDLQPISPCDHAEEEEEEFDWESMYFEEDPEQHSTKLFDITPKFSTGNLRQKARIPVARIPKPSAAKYQD